jgi:hypothetical protein
MLPKYHPNITYPHESKETKNRKEETACAQRDSLVLQGAHRAGHIAAMVLLQVTVKCLCATVGSGHIMLHPRAEAVVVLVTVVLVVRIVVVLTAVISVASGGMPAVSVVV